MAFPVPAGRMNPQGHWGGEQESETDAAGGGTEQKPAMHGAAGKTHMHIHSHDKGVTVHVMHSSGKHEKHQHAHGDAEGIAQHVHENFGSASPEAESQSEDSSGTTGY